MKVTIAKVFPDSVNRYCMWHIMQKFPSKVGPIFCAESGFMDKLNKFVWSSHLTVAEFKEGWNAVLKEFGLTDHVWLKDIYSMRKSWIPAFFRDKPMGALLRTMSSLASQPIVVDGVNKYVVRDKSFDEKFFVVEFSFLKNDVQCLCKLFTRVGYLCRHCFYILGLWGVERIPQQFLCTRWMRNAELRFSKLKFGKETERSNGSIIRDTSKQISSEFQACFGSVSSNVDGLNFMLDGMKSLKISIADKFQIYGVTKDDMLQECFGVRPSGLSKVLPPLQSNNKGSRKRIAGPAELSCDGKKRKLRMCKTCNSKGYHDSRKCPSKLIQLQTNSSLQSVQTTLNQGNVQEYPSSSQILVDMSSGY
ncbi:protein FAR1-RELATED SEQUENCE 1-like [Apium graveolens]|uniref:protein FAR1-RELATED SEQUENCE 1-like n=1 Tax=Apium graveolens TaxID=4045 RepID=UPI003D7B6C59